MTLGEKIAKARRDNNITQEQLADYLDVSRQSVSKWESDVAFPETGKLVRMSELFGCSLDYLLKDNVTEQSGGEKRETQACGDGSRSVFCSFMRVFEYEYKSKRTFCGMPLVHINIGAGRTAKGVIAVGFKSIGMISVGLLSVGLLSVGLLALGLLGLGMAGAGLFGFGAFALGLLSGGAISVGLISFGAISIGVMSSGAVAIGQFAVGALARGHYFAFGDDASAMVALGATKAVGTLYTHFTGVQNSYAGYDAAAVVSVLQSSVPPALKWFMDMALSIAGVR